MRKERNHRKGKEKESFNLMVKNICFNIRACWDHFVSDSVDNSFAEGLELFFHFCLVFTEESLKKKKNRSKGEKEEKKKSKIPDNSQSLFVIFIKFLLVFFVFNRR